MRVCSEYLFSRLISFERKLLVQNIISLISHWTQFVKAQYYRYSTTPHPDAEAEQEHPDLLLTAGHLHFWQIKQKGFSNSLHVTSVFNAMNA